jgi:hypothetical protein
MAAKRRDVPATEVPAPHSFTLWASANGTRGAVMFGGNASERRGPSGSYSAVHNGPFTADVVFELINQELLITDCAFDKIAD